MGVIHLPSRRDSRGWSRARIAKVSRRWYRARVGLRKVRGQRAKQCSGSSTEDREGPAGVVVREDREAPEYFSLEDLPESSGDELGIDRTTETVSRTEAISRTESGAVPETGSSSPAAANKLRGGAWRNHIVDESELRKEARVVAEVILRNNQDLVLRYKSASATSLAIHPVSVAAENGEGLA
ncbi:hypothetical protein RHSIM_Rhsim12G0160000 [Rhododendron simsii]|uniref:Uncharacterized protein n=1 Tax=Rhododendron simsii TaxID=118357 RepID=A0A834L9B0_RHOSS|nr:hypothetical protein RHSIM_Rhsim12G0160000 [Rhododendron simsii]